MRLSESNGTTSKRGTSLLKNKQLDGSARCRRRMEEGRTLGKKSLLRGASAEDGAPGAGRGLMIKEGTDGAENELEGQQL
jgi:hypothetical protein